MMQRIIEFDIVDLAYNGQAIGYDNGKVTFVNGGLPGERVRAEIVKSKKRHNQARLVRILSKSPERIDPVCRHYDICGGCIWQDLDYERQLHYKRNQIITSLEHIGKFKDVDVGKVRRSPDIFFYRNKMEFSFNVCPPGEAGRGFVLGLHEKGHFDRIFDVVECRLQSEFSNQLVVFLREKVAEVGIPAYDLTAHRGFLRFAVIREGKNSGQVMLVLVSGGGEFIAKGQLVSALIEAFPQLTTIVWVMNDKMTNIAQGGVCEVLHGPGYIEEEILGLRFRISPGSFFQTNSRQSEALYRTAIELAEIERSDNLLDLYCGAGPIGLCAASKAGRVIGIDIDEEAVDAARVNAEINGVENSRFFAGPIRTALASDDLRGIRFDVVINDPPRAGMHPKAIKRLLEINAGRLIYISCNPATFARDAAILCKAGYDLCEIIPFDMFPHTMHIELVSRFEKSD